MPQSVYDKISRSPSNRLEKFLGKLELAVMEIVWAKAPMSVRDVQDNLNRVGRPLAYTTVMTIMGRLADKGWLVAEKKGRAFHYRPVRSRSEAEAEVVGGVVRALLQDFGDVAVTQFVRELDVIHPDQLSRLAELAQEAEQSKDATSDN